MFVFPGIGLGATLCGAKRITDRMLYESAVALAKFLPPEDLAQGKVFPPVDQIRLVSLRIAMAIIEEAERDGLVTKPIPEDDRANFVARKMYYPEYVPLVEKREVTI